MRFIKIATIAAAMGLPMSANADLFCGTHTCVQVVTNPSQVIGTHCRGLSYLAHRNGRFVCVPYTLIQKKPLPNTMYKR